MTFQVFSTAEIYMKANNALLVNTIYKRWALRAAVLSQEGHSTREWNVLNRVEKSGVAERCEVSDTRRREGGGSSLLLTRTMESWMNGLPFTH